MLYELSQQVVKVSAFGLRYWGYKFDLVKWASKVGSHLGYTEISSVFINKISSYIYFYKKNK